MKDIQIQCNVLVMIEKQEIKLPQVTTINAAFLIQNLQHLIRNAPCITEQQHRVLLEKDMKLGDNRS